MSTDAPSPISASPASLAVEIRSCPFDLVARAELASAGCTGLMDPDRGGQPYTYAEFHTEPPIALHAPWDYADSSGRLLEALTLARIMTETAPDERDEAYARILRSCQRPDGLISLPADPWTCPTPVVELEWSPRGALLAWATRFLALDDVDAVRRAQHLVHGLNVRAIWKGDTCWFPASYLPESGWGDRLSPPERMTDVIVGAQIVFPLTRFAEVSGSEEAIQLAGGLIRFLLHRSGAFEPSGKFTEQSGRSFSSHTGFILGVLKYGLITGKDELVSWARAAYDYARTWGADFGFFPHTTEGPERWQGDVCATADMVESALLLGLHRDPAYLVDAERFGRNHLLESQLLDFEWVENRVDAPFCQELWCAHHEPEGVTTEDVCTRSLGAFGGWTRPNDAFDPKNPRLMMRCTGAGVRALYALWHYAITRQEEAVVVHLPFSRDTRWATVTAQPPQEGGVEVMMKVSGVLAVRVPPGVTEEQVEVIVNGNRPRHETLRSGYAWIEALRHGDVVEVKWPLEERAMLYELDGTRYTGNWRGDTLLRMHPVGTLSPLYWRPLETPAARPRGASGPVKEIDSL